MFTHFKAKFTHFLDNFHLCLDFRIHCSSCASFLGAYLDPVRNLYIFPRRRGEYISLFAIKHRGWFENLGPLGKNFGHVKHIFQINEDRFLKAVDFAIYTGEEFLIFRMVVGNKFKFLEKYLPLEVHILSIC